MKRTSKKLIVKKGQQNKKKNKNEKEKKKKKKKEKEKKNKKKVKEGMGFSDEETRTFNHEDESNYEDRENFRLPKITKEGIITYDHGCEEESIRTPEEEKGKKWHRQEQKFKKILERSRKREEERLKKKQEKTASEQYIEKIKNKLNKLKDIKGDISALANGIIGDQTANIANFDVLFFIFYETLKRNKKGPTNKKKGQKETNESYYKKQTEVDPQKAFPYLEEANILSIISICTVLKYITPSYKLISDDGMDEGEANSEKEYAFFNKENKNKGKYSKKKNEIVPTRFSKLIKNVNNLEKAIAKYYDKFCTILKENIKWNAVVYVNLLCEIITVNLYLSKEKGLFQLLIIYANRATYANRKYNATITNCNIPEKNDGTLDILCMNCLNTLSEIITNDANLFFTSYLIKQFSNLIFTNKNNVSPSLLKVFSNLNIREKKMSAKIYATEIKNEQKGKLNKKEEIELKKKNISGDLKIIEKNVDKILDELFLIYLCVLKKYTHYSSIFIKNVLFAIADYSIYINKYIMDDVLEEIKVIAKDNKTAPSLRITSIHIFLKILNKFEDNIYIDCSWICDALLYILDSSPCYFSVGSCLFLFENVNFPITSFLDHKEHLNNKNYIEKENAEEEDLKKYWVTEDQHIKVGSIATKVDKQKERANFSAEVLYCIDMLLKTKSFVSNFQSTNNNILCRIIYQLYNIALHSDYIISMAILKQIQLVMVKFPLVKCIIGKEGTVISCLDDNISTFYQNMLFHSSYFNDISAIALDLTLNDSDEKYFQTIKNYIQEKKRFVKNEIIYLNLNLNEQRFIDEDILMSYNPSEIYKNEKKKNPKLETTVFKKAEDIAGSSCMAPNTHTVEMAVQQLPSYMLTANDFVKVIFSPIQCFINSFQKKKKKKKKSIENCNKKENINKKYNHINKISQNLSIRTKLLQSNLRGRKWYRNKGRKKYAQQY